MMFLLWLFLMVAGSGAFAGGVYFICAARSPFDYLLSLGLMYVAWDLWRTAIVVPPKKKL